MKSVSLYDSIRKLLGFGKRFGIIILIIKVEFVEGESEFYQLPVGFLTSERAKNFEQRWTRAIISRVKNQEGNCTGILYDGFYNEEFCSGLMELMSQRKLLKGDKSSIRSFRTEKFREYCQHHNLVLDKLYVDEAKLSSNTEKRDALQEMLSDRSYRDRK